MGTVSTACKAFQCTLRHVWASGSTYAEMTIYLGVTKDQLFRLRDRLKLPLRLDRSIRKKGPRHKDPSPEEIARMCAELRTKHLADRAAEPPTRQYRQSNDRAQFRLERFEDRDDDALERWLDAGDL